MNLFGGKNRIVDMLVDMENITSSIYEYFSGQFKDMEMFWKQLSLEEKKHAESICDIPEQFDEDRIFTNEKRINREHLEQTLKYFRKNLDEIKGKDLTREEALKIAMNIENTQEEKQFYRIFDGDPEVLKKILSELDCDERAHRERIRDLLDRI